MKIRESLDDKESRHAYLGSFQDGRLALQIETMREASNLSQRDLAAIVGTGQSRISEMESGEYDGFSLRSLRNLAEAFDVALLVRFATFNEAVLDCETIRGSAPVSPGFSVRGYQEWKASEAGVHVTIQAGSTPGRDFAAEISAFLAKSVVGNWAQGTYLSVADLHALKMKPEAALTPLTLESANQDLALVA